MVFYPNATINIAGLTVEKNAEGTKIKKFDFEKPLESFRADVQPNVLTKEQIEIYGIDERTAETKRVFFTDAENMKAGNRAQVVYDNGSVEVYNICPVNKWRVHCEALLIPVGNE